MTSHGSAKTPKIDNHHILGFAYGLEQALNARRQPQFLGAITPIPNAGLCNTPHQPQGKAHLPHGRIF